MEYTLYTDLLLAKILVIQITIKQSINSTILTNITG